MSPGWKGLVTGGGDGRPGLRITGHGYAHALHPSRRGHDLDRRLPSRREVLVMADRLRRWRGSVVMETAESPRARHLDPPRFYIHDNHRRMNCEFFVAGALLDAINTKN